MTRILIVLVLVLAMSACYDKVLLGTPRYLDEEWTIRIADHVDENGACGGPHDKDETLREPALNFTVKRNGHDCMRIEAARRVTAGGTFNVSLNGTDQMFSLEVDDAQRQHTDGHYGETPSTSWVQIRPGQRILLIIEPTRTTSNGSLFSISWNGTTAPDPSAMNAQRAEARA